VYKLLTGNDDTAELSGVASKITQSAIANIAQHFCGRRKRIANIAITKFHGSPEIKCGFVNIA
jgi:hypothetical protein